MNGPGLPALGPVAAAAGVEDVLAQHVPEACTVETPDETGTVGSEGLGGRIELLSVGGEAGEQVASPGLGG